MGYEFYYYGFAGLLTILVTLGVCSLGTKLAKVRAFLYDFSGTLQQYGLTKRAAIVKKVASGDLIGAVHDFAMLEALEIQHPELAIAEFEDAFQTVMAAKLSTADGRQKVQAALSVANQTKVS